MDVLHQLVYVSKSQSSWDDLKTVEFLKRIRAKNHAKGVTGMLLFYNQSFLQILEGRPEVLSQLFATICTDPRHSQVVTILEKPIAKRQFPDWSMGFEHVSAEKLQSVEGFNDFFDEKTCLLDIDAGRAKKILTAFEQGRWQ